MKLTKVDLSDLTNVKKFIHFPFELYRKSKYWVPPFISTMMKNMDPNRHPFYTHSEAEFFMVLDGEQPIGRIAVMENRRFNQYRNKSTAFFGFFDCINDQTAANTLFEAAIHWAKNRGLDTMMGPKGLLGSEAGGVLVEGFEYIAAVSMPYNFPYYDELIRSAGFQKDTDHLSGYLRADHQLPERIFRIAEKVKDKRGFWVKSFQSKEEMKTWIPRVARVHADAFANNYSFIPPTEKEMEMIGHSIISIADPPLVKLVMKGEDVVGFLISYHGISKGIQRAKGKLMPFGWMWILLDKKFTKWVNVNGVGLLPTYQGSGANAILYTELQKTIRAYPFKHVEVVQVDEKNFASFSDMENIGVQWRKRHRGYWRNL